MGNKYLEKNVDLYFDKFLESGKLFNRDDNYKGRYFYKSMVIELVNTNPLEQCKSFVDILVKDPVIKATFVHEFGHFLSMTSTLTGAYINYLYCLYDEIKVELIMMACHNTGNGIPKEGIDAYIKNNQENINQEFKLKYVISEILNLYTDFLLTGKYNKKLDCIFKYSNNTPKYGFDALLENYSFFHEIIYRHRHCNADSSFLEEEFLHYKSEYDEMYTVLFDHLNTKIELIHIVLFMQILDFSLMGWGKLKDLFISVDEMIEALSRNKKIEIFSPYDYLKQHILNETVWNSNLWTEYIKPTKDPEHCKPLLTIEEMFSKKADDFINKKAEREIYSFNKINKEILNEEFTYTNSIQMMQKFLDNSIFVFDEIDNLLIELICKSTGRTIPFHEKKTQKERFYSGLEFRKKYGPMMVQISDCPEMIIALFFESHYNPTIIVNNMAMCKDALSRDIGVLVYKQLIDDMSLEHTLRIDIHCPFEALRIICDKKGCNYCNIGNIKRSDREMCIVNEKYTILETLFGVKQD